MIGRAAGCYLRQLTEGLAITGLSRDVTWGLYIAQFTFLVGVAASAVMVVLPYYLHDFKAFGRITVLGEFLAVAAVAMCMLFIFVDLGQPGRAFNMILHPDANSRHVLGHDRPRWLPRPERHDHPGEPRPPSARVKPRRSGSSR